MTKNSENVVVHFYREETFRCKIFDKHFNILAKKHFETKFCKINAEKCPFLCDRLKIRVIPSVLLIKNQQTKGHIMGFTELGNTDEFSTEMLEWRLAHVSSKYNYHQNLFTFYLFVRARLSTIVVTLILLQMLLLRNRRLTLWARRSRWEHGEARSRGKMIQMMKMIGEGEPWGGWGLLKYCTASQ